jgi:hypothetical protein
MVSASIPSLIVAVSLSTVEAVSQLPPATRVASLPENPCAVLTVEQVAVATGMHVIESRRLPSDRDIVEAEREHREPAPSAICAYSTDSAFGEIIISVPSVSERRSARYWEARETYFHTFPGSARAIPNLGIDAWLGGGASLSVLAREDQYFSVSTQMYQEGSRQVLIALGRAVLERLN